MLKTINPTQSNLSSTTSTPAVSGISVKPVTPMKSGSMQSLQTNKKADNSKMKSFLAIGALIVFIGLASLAVLISQKQQDGRPVAPNAPESKPQAFVEKLESCSLTFEVPAQCNSVCMTTEDCKKVNPDWVCSDGIATTPTPVVSPTTKPCTSNAQCDTGFTCYQPPMLVCPAGQFCPQVMPAPYCLPNAQNTTNTRYCRLEENVTSVTCMI